MNKRRIGIDPGESGALCFTNSEKKDMHTHTQETPLCYYTHRDQRKQKEAYIVYINLFL